MRFLANFSDMSNLSHQAQRVSTRIQGMSAGIQECMNFWTSITFPMSRLILMENYKKTYGELQGSVTLHYYIYNSIIFTVIWHLLLSLFLRIIIVLSPIKNLLLA